MVSTRLLHPLALRAIDQHERPRTGSRRGNGRSVERVTNIETAAWSSSSSSSIQTTNGRESVFCLLILLAYPLPTLPYSTYLT